MNPAAVLAIIKYIQLAIAAAPDIERAVLDAKTFISQLFAAKLLTIEQQSMLHSHVDSVAAIFAEGQKLPSHWTVEPNPV